MGFKIFEDKIGALSVVGGSIFLAASRITIGLQQYYTTGASIALPTLSSTTLYMVYAVISGGIPTLVISTNFNSVGPGATAWKLVGAFYSDGQATPGFGSFVTIKGVPRTLNPIIGGPIILNTYSSAGTLSNSQAAKPAAQYITADRYVWERDGALLYQRLEYGHTSAGVVGSGDYGFGLPPNLNADTTKAVMNQNLSGANLNSSNLGPAHAGSSSAPASGGGFVSLFMATMVRIFTTSTGATNNLDRLSSGWFQMNNGGLTIDAAFWVPIAGWNETSLEDK